MHLLVVFVAICMRKQLQFNPWRFHALGLVHESIQNEAIQQLCNQNFSLISNGLKVYPLSYENTLGNLLRIVFSH